MCKHFKCTEDPRGCMECYNGVCDGTGYDGHRLCGCELCEFYSMKEDEEICTYGDRDQEYDFHVSETSQAS